MKFVRCFAAVIGCSLAFQAFALPQNDTAHPKRLHIEPDVAVGLLTHSVKAEYPESARADHVSGEVHLRIVIDQQGKVIEAVPVSRNELPPLLSLTEDPRLRGAAMDAVKQWEYRPYLLNGQPVEVETQVVVNFKAPGVMGGVIRSVAPPPNPALPRRLRVSAAVMEGNLLKHVAPVYALIPREAPMQGEVRLQAVVSKTGDVINLRAISGHPILIQSAMYAVRQWQYKPFLLNGEPVEAEGIVIVDFKR